MNANESPSMTSEEYARQLQEKIDFYLLALVFTLLGLAIQTAKFQSSDVADALELTGWLSLAVSGVAGLSRLEWLPVSHLGFHRISTLTSEKTSLEKLAISGQTKLQVTDSDTPQDITWLISKRDEAIDNLEKNMDDLQESTLSKYRVHKVCLLLGIALLTGARGYPPALELTRKYFGPALEAVTGQAPASTATPKQP